MLFLLNEINCYVTIRKKINVSKVVYFAIFLSCFSFVIKSNVSCLLNKKKKKQEFFLSVNLS